MTAVEWLYEISKEREIDKFDLEKAKEMEKWQRMKFEIPELSDEEISIGAINFCTKNIDTEVMHWSDIFEYACKWYREQLKQRQ